MTMFSQKTPFNLADFLNKPATSEARRLLASQRRKRWPTDQQPAEATVSAVKLKDKSPKIGE